jgi:hypothetical protein
MDKMSDEDLLGCVGLVFGAPMVLGGIVMRAWTTSLMWAWFAVPLFGLPPLTLWQACGLRILAGAFTFDASDTKVPKDKDEWKGYLSSLFVGAFVLPLVMLGLAWGVRVLAFGGGL